MKSTVVGSSLTSVGTLTTLQIDDININDSTISSTNTNGDITITPNGTGDIILDGQKWPQADGTANYVLKTNGSGQLSWGTAASAAGGVALSNGANNRIVTATGSEALNGESNLTFDGSTLGVTGDLTVQEITVSGDTVTVNTATLSVEDPLIYMGNGQTGSPSVDIGLIGERGSSQNTGIIWDESTDTWAVINTDDTGTTAGNVTIASYANMKAATFTGNLTGNADTVTNGVYTSGNQTIAGIKTLSSYMVLTGDNTAAPSDLTSVHLGKMVDN